MKITLKDNVVAEVTKGTTVMSVVSGISESLAKSAICGKINGSLVDLTAEIGKNCKLEIITQKDKDAITVLWHSSSHILAQAVKAIYPNAKLASGTSTDNGFYYDFDFRTPISLSDLSLIEDEMQKIIDANFQVVKTNITKEQAFLLAEENEEPYKLEIINKIPSSEGIGLFTQGDFSDFSIGPHIKSTGLVKAFKLTSIDKTYFDNDPNNKMLTRISGVSFFYKKDLDQFLKNQELIKKRNHIEVGKQLGYFAKDAMTDKIIFLKQGQRVLNSMQEFIGNLSDEYGFSEISLPSLDNKNNEIIEATAYRVSDKDKIIFPIRYYIKETIEPKFINLARGLFDYSINTRDKFVVFSRVETIDAEFKQLFEMVKAFYLAFGFNVSVRLHVGEHIFTGEYSKVKGILKRTIDKKFGSTNKIQSGYHKADVLKVEYLITDTLGREWSMGSLHVDFSYAQNNGIALSVDNKLEFPVTIVNNTCKSLEKLFAVIIEDRAGEMPFWLTPTTIKIVATDAKAVQKSKKLAQTLLKYRVYSDVYLAHKGKIKADNEIPLTVILGKEELSEGTVKILNKDGCLSRATNRKLIQEILRAKFARSILIPKIS